jgi:hypothetical protein
VNGSLGASLNKAKNHLLLIRVKVKVKSQAGVVAVQGTNDERQQRYLWVHKVDDNLNNFLLLNHHYSN